MADPNAVHRLQVFMPAASLISKDTVNFDFHVLFNGTLAGTTGTQIGDAVKAFIVTNQGRFGVTVATSGHTIKMFDLRDPKPRVPEQVYGPFTIAPGADSVAREQALCVSWNALVPSGGIRQRYYNRFYFGPFNLGNGGTLRPSSAICTALVNSFKTMVDTINALSATPPPVFCVYSPKDGVGRPVTRIFCDDEWDTQRRRGLKKTLTATAIPA